MTDLQMEALELVRQEIREVREWLMTPNADTLAASASALERAVRSMMELTNQPVSKPGLHLRDEAGALAGEIRQVRHLLRAGSELYFGRLREYVGTESL